YLDGRQLTRPDERIRLGGRDVEDLGHLGELQEPLGHVHSFFGALVAPSRRFDPLLPGSSVRPTPDGHGAVMVQEGLPFDLTCGCMRTPSVSADVATDCRFVRCWVAMTAPPEGGTGRDPPRDAPH